MKLTKAEKELLTLSIFEGIDEDFEDYWDKHKEDWHESEQAEAKKRVWAHILDWIKKYWELDHAIISERGGDGPIECMVETRQEYVNFTPRDVVQAIGKLGELARHMYCAGRDYLPTNFVLRPREYCPLAQYYYLALERIVWRVASFSQRDGGGADFTDLHTRLGNLLNTVKMSKTKKAPAASGDKNG